MEVLEQIKALCDGIEYSRRVPKEAEELAKANNCIIIVGGSDDLMYCYGADCYLTDYIEHSCWEGRDFTENDNTPATYEGRQLGLKAYWGGAIDDVPILEDYDTDEMGAFSYSVKEGVKALDFKVMERYLDGTKEVYCTGKIIQLPDDFKPCKRINK